jgi:hypothetical protein
MNQAQLNFNNHPTLSFDTYLGFNENKRILTHYISTETVNRYGYILKNEGIDDTNYRKNPVVLYEHYLGGLFSMPPPSEIVIGINLKLSHDLYGIIAETKFADTELGTDIMNFYKDKLLNAWSVRWKGIGENYIEYVNDVPVVQNWELLEYSAVVIPGNPDAVTQMLKYSKDEGLKKILNGEMIIVELRDEISRANNKISSLIDDFDNSRHDDGESIGKKLNNLKNELKSQIGDVKKWAAEMFMELALSQQSLPGNLHKELLSRMPEIVEGAIRKYIGKVD